MPFHKYQTRLKVNGSEQEKERLFAIFLSVDEYGRVQPPNLRIMSQDFNHCASVAQSTYQKEILSLYLPELVAAAGFKPLALRL